MNDADPFKPFENLRPRPAWKDERLVKSLVSLIGPISTKKDRTKLIRDFFAQRHLYSHPHPSEQHIKPTT